ncbi:hypothetical protein EDC51_103106 [Bibersteinia trehalosi]|uniref:hypothetical protein n=1 Tax=Bibersteinia trehalosi TaxID=47735 RepID=UPI0010431470|nr:hypothetical protein [Bibersteinia trehalosi]TCT17353.1 hypothetical protein EDC51_103106 [Bibersteinia trehalosi]
MKKLSKFLVFVIFALFLTACSSSNLSEQEQGYRDYQKMMVWKEQHKKLFFLYGVGLENRPIEKNKELLSMWKPMAKESADKLNIKNDLAQKYIDASLNAIYSLVDMLSFQLEGNKKEAHKLFEISEKYAAEADNIEKELHNKFAK